MTSSIIPVILSGGAGTRLWPLSRKYYPKQLLDLSGEGLTMLQATAKRVGQFEDPIIVCSEEHRFIVAEQMAQIDVTPAAILLEPEGRNTAPAIALAALFATKLSEDATIGVFPADHVIENEEEFLSSVRLGIESTNNKKLVTFGVCPHKPETGYGYLKVPQVSVKEAQDVLEFVEKPDLETANSYLESGEYLWNSGMFLFTAQQYLQELKQFEGGIVESCIRALEKANTDLDFIRIDKDNFANCKDISVDYAVMERSSNVVSVALDVGWSDVGNWQSLWEVTSKDENGNVLRGDILNFQAQDCFVHSGEKLTSLLGVKDLVIVDTDDTLLVAHKEAVQDVKKFPKLLEQMERTEHLHHRTVHRPWGSYDSLSNGTRYQVKKLIVKPGAELSLQLHHHRAEHWVVVQGTALVTLNEDKKLLSENESIYIPLGSKHRLSNPGKIPLEVIEVQSGSYLGEDDIVRFQDNYKRNQ